MDAKSAPAFSWFSSSEGVYTLIASYLTPVTYNFLGASAPSLGQTTPNAVSTAQTPHIDPTTVLPPPPAHPSRFAVVSVKYALPKETSGLGMSMLRSGGSKQRNDDTVHSDLGNPAPNGREPIPIPSTASPIIPDGVPLASPPPSTSTTTKRRPLTSSFSIPTLSSLGSSVSPPGMNEAGPSSSRPQRAFKGTSSTFVRSWEGLPLSQVHQRMLQESNAGKETTFVFVTSGKGVLLLESGSGKLKEPLSKLIFAAPPSAIDVSQHTASSQQLDCLVGFATGDIFWFASPVTCIQWLPHSRAYSANENHANLFASTHADGSVFIWDKEREDAPFTPTTPQSPGSPRSPFSSSWHSNGVSAVDARERNALRPIVVSKPAPVVDKKGVGIMKHNPVTHWKVSSQAINAMAFSPDLRFCALVGEDGLLRIVDVAAEALTDVYASYFGALRCVDWSSDGRFVVTGGQDDLCTIYAPSEQRLVARCQGHSSWVTAVQWDPWRSDDRTMRFASVGEDCKLVLWDLSSAALSRPKTHGTHIAHRRPSASSLSLARRKTIESASGYPLSNDSHGDDGPLYHAAPPRSEVALLQPVVVKALSSDVFVGLRLLSHSVLLLSRSAQIRHYDRPPEGEAARIGLLTSNFAASTVDINSRAR